MDVAINIEQFMILPFVGGGVLYSTRKILDAIGKYGNRFSEILRCLQQIESRCDTIVSNAPGRYLLSEALNSKSDEGTLAMLHQHLNPEPPQSLVVTD